VGGFMGEFTGEFTGEFMAPVADVFRGTWMRPLVAHRRALTTSRDGAMPKEGGRRLSPRNAGRARGEITTWPDGLPALPCRPASIHGLDAFRPSTTPYRLKDGGRPS